MLSMRLKFIMNEFYSQLEAINLGAIYYKYYLVCSQNCLLLDPIQVNF